MTIEGAVPSGSSQSYLSPGPGPAPLRSLVPWTSAPPRQPPSVPPAQPRVPSYRPAPGAVVAHGATSDSTSTKNFLADLSKILFQFIAESSQAASVPDRRTLKLRQRSSLKRSREFCRFGSERGNGNLRSSTLDLSGPQPPSPEDMLYIVFALLEGKGRRARGATGAAMRLRPR
jgi:hypothetical protein